MNKLLLDSNNIRIHQNAAIAITQRCVTDFQSQERHLLDIRMA
jgi:hypothetical protein